MILKSALDQLAKSQTYLDFTKQNPQFYLSSCFAIINEKNKDYRWEIGLYSKDQAQLVVFETYPQIRMREPEETITPDHPAPLDLSKVHVTIDQLTKICDDLVQDKYSSHSITKRIVILQTIEKEIFNVTLVTSTFNVLNVKVDAATGEILSHNLQSLMNFGRREK